MAKPRTLIPRKRPRQARATATLDAIFEAALQLLVNEGPQRLTTTRVAERAGVSVGTMYQYFPHKESLLYVLNERYLEALAGKVEAACLTFYGLPASPMVEGLIETYWRAKTERPDVTRALYLSIAELDNGPLVNAFRRRVNAAVSAMLLSASDMKLVNIESVSLILITVIFGAVRNTFEMNLPEATGAILQRQLIQMCQTYLMSLKDVEIELPVATDR